MRITSIKQQIKNPERVSIFIDGKYEFSLSLDQLAQVKIKIDDELTEAHLKKFQKLSADGKLRALALEWLLNRPHSKREFKDYLYRKKADPALSESLTTEFTKKKYLNDEVYAKWLVDLRSRKSKSDRAIRAELLAKGVDPQIISKVLEEAPQSEQNRLESLYEKKKNMSRYKNDPQKLTRYLVAQGFSYSSVKKMITKEN